LILTTKRTAKLLDLAVREFFCAQASFCENTVAARWQFIIAHQDRDRRAASSENMRARDDAVSRCPLRTPTTKTLLITTT
jgi:hypothetical protein